MTDEIPIVDLSKCGLQVDDAEICDEAIRDVGKILYRAFTTSGFVYLSNHGLPSESVDGVNEVAEQFYSLPLEEKRKFYFNKAEFGYDPIGSTKANPKREFDYFEGFRIAGSAIEDESTPWPNVPKFKEKLLAFADMCKVLEMRLLKALGSAMRLKDPEYFCKCHSLMNKKGNMSTMKVVSYPPVPTDDSLKENQFRVADHTDWTTLILLFQDQNGGLQSINAKGEFADVTPIPGTIIVNLGETIQKWSGGRLRATLHRVVPPRDQSNRMNTRRSIVYFGQADDNALMEEFEYEDGFGHEASNDQTDKITVKEYMDRRFIEVFS